MSTEPSEPVQEARQSYDASVRFVGLVHALRASAETALGDDTNPLRLARRQGLEGVKAAKRSLGLLEMLQEKTLGNLDESEREELWHALRGVRAALVEAEERLAELEAGSGLGAVALPTLEPGSE
jgi:hypothetical protein